MVQKREHLSERKPPGCLLIFLKDDKLPNDVGILVKYCRDPYQTTKYAGKQEDFLVVHL